MLRHEQQTVRMALAAALRHSAGPKEKKVELQQHAALRGPNTGARAREGEVHEKYDASRRQNAPHPGERPSSLSDPVPQRSDRSLRRSAGDCLPTLALPVLAGSAGEPVDARTLRFLLDRSLAEEEEEGGVRQAGGGVPPGVLGACSGAPRIQEEEEEEEEKEASQNLFLFRPPSSSTTAVVCAGWFFW